MSAARLAIALQKPGPTTFTVAAGTCVAITGRSGSGKSVLLRAIADLDESTGEVTLDGRARATFTGPAWRRNIVYCAAESGWWRDIVGEHFPPPWPAALAERLGLPADIWGREVRLCSTGERQRLALLRSFALESPVLLLDEPTGPLDAESVAAVESILRGRLAAGSAIILVTHSPEQAARLGDIRYVMEAGRLT